LCGLQGNDKAGLGGQAGPLQRLSGQEHLGVVLGGVGKCVARCGADQDEPIFLS